MAKESTIITTNQKNPTIAPVIVWGLKSME